MRRKQLVLLGVMVCLSTTPWAVSAEQRAKLLAADGEAYDRFGVRVALDGGAALIGADEDDDNGSTSGSAYVFIPLAGTAGVWSQQAKLVSADGAAFDRFGLNGAIDGDTVVIGAMGDDDLGSNSGSAYVFTRTSGVWSQQAELLASARAVPGLKK